MISKKENKLKEVMSTKEGLLKVARAMADAISLLKDSDRSINVHRKDKK